MAEECGGIERKESNISLKPLLESYRLLSLPFHLATKKERLHLVNLNVELLCYCVVPLIFFSLCLSPPELQKYRRYEIVMTAYNIIGESPPSAPFEVFVGEAGTERLYRPSVIITDVKIIQ